MHRPHVDQVRAARGRRRPDQYSLTATGPDLLQSHSRSAHICTPQVETWPAALIWFIVFANHNMKILGDEARLPSQEKDESFWLVREMWHAEHELSPIDCTTLLYNSDLRGAPHGAIGL